MRIIPPKPFTFGSGERAVLLLHGFTGNTADVRMLGRFLQKRGYTSHAPLYRGHGVPPEQLLSTTADDWWQDVVRAYQFLKEAGHEEIAVVGLSIGGVFSLKLGYTFPVKGIIPMCAPMTDKKEIKADRGFLKYAREYKQYEGKEKEQIKKEMEALQKEPSETLNSISKLKAGVREHLESVDAPTFVIQARHDEMIDTKSAEIIYNKVGAKKKNIKWYEYATHVITFSEEKEQLQEDVFRFLEMLDWSGS